MTLTFKTDTATQVDDEVHFAPLYRLILLNDDVNGMRYVVQVLQSVFRWSFQRAAAVTYEAHYTGAALCGVWPLEHAEVHQHGLNCYGLTSTLEPET